MNAPMVLKPAVPANLDAEQALLGAVLISGEIDSAITAILSPAHFIEPVHRVIYATALDMVRMGRRPTVVTIRDYLPANVTIVDGMDLGGYVARLAAEATTLANIADFARAIVDQATRRGLIDVAIGIQESALAPDVRVPPATIIAEAEARLYELGRDLTRVGNRGPRFAGLIADDILSGLESPEPLSPPISTGLADLDRLIGGYRRGNLIILAGRPGMGKTAIAASSALTVAEHGRPVLFFSKDMPASELIARMLTDLAYTSTEPIAYEEVLNQIRFDARQIDMLREARRKLKTLPIIIDQRKGLGMAEIAISARRWAERQAKDGRPSGLIVCDHLGKIKTDRHDNRNIELGDITNGAVFTSYVATVLTNGVLDLTAPAA